MEKRTLVAVAVCMGILLLWWRLFPPGSPPVTPPPEAPTAAGEELRRPADAPPPAPEGAPAAPAAAAERRAEERVVLETDVARYVLSSWGGTLVEQQLRDEKYREDRRDPASGLTVLRSPCPRTRAGR
jgi:YidC/Oxa1 family membrane protein insertase